MSRICSSPISVPVGQAFSSRTAMAVSPVFAGDAADGVDDDVVAGQGPGSPGEADLAEQPVLDPFHFSCRAGSGSPRCPGRFPEASGDQRWRDRAPSHLDDRPAVHHPAQGLDRARVIFAGHLQPEPLHRRGGPARVQRAAHQVVEGVGRLDDAAAQRRPGRLPPGRR